MVILGLPPVDSLDVTGPAEVFAYHGVDVLRKAFVRRMRVSPKEYAQHFAPVEMSKARNRAA
ncbi:hypothetical protein CES87_18110 [Pseudomonas sp. ERMR1:02]|nr:hypothetical protein CES87_18110 [Pseudomonas sp. ERMR1:02]